MHVVFSFPLPECDSQNLAKTVTVHTESFWGDAKHTHTHTYIHTRCCEWCLCVCVANYVWGNGLVHNTVTSHVAPLSPFHCILSFLSLGMYPQRVTVLGLWVCGHPSSVCLSVTTFSATTCNKPAKRATPTGSALHWLDYEFGDYKKLQCENQVNKPNCHWLTSTALRRRV